jgi:hypothetical protein
MSTFGTWVDKPWARRLGDVASEVELPDADVVGPPAKKGLDSLCLSAESDLAAWVQKDDWTSSDALWPSVQEIVTYHTAALIIDLLYSDEKHLNKANEYRMHGLKLVEGLRAAMGAAGDNPAITVIASDYTSKGLYDSVHPGSTSGPQHYLSDF